MNPVSRELVVIVIRLLLIALGIWFAFSDSALGAGAHVVTRIGLVLICFVLSILVGELARLRSHFGLLVGALRAAGGGGGQSAASAAAAAQALGGGEVPSADPRDSIDILIRALSAKEADTCEKAHQHLMRLTGKKLPLQPALWERWWQENREGYHAPPDAGGNPDAGA